MSLARDAAREMLVSATSGAVASAVAKLFLYPLESSRLWLVNKKSDETIREVLAKLWAAGLYIGFPVKVTKNVVQKFIFFYIFEGILQINLRMRNARRRLRGEPQTTEVGTAALLACGYLGEALGIPIFAPLEYVAMQVQTSRTGEGAFSVVQRTLQQRGVAGFYPGWPVYLLCALNPMIKQTLVERGRSFLLRGQDRQSAHLSSSAAFWLGALSQAVAGTIAYPVNVGRIVIQAGGKRQPKLDISSAAETPDDDFLFSPKRRGEGGTGKSADASEPSHDDTVGLPSDFQRNSTSIMDMQGIGAEEEHNIFRVLARIGREEGVQGLFKGLSTEIVEGMLGSAVQLVIKERVTAGVRAVVYAGKRVR